MVFKPHPFWASQVKKLAEKTSDCFLALELNVLQLINLSSLRTYAYLQSHLPLNLAAPEVAVGPSKVEHHWHSSEVTALFWLVVVHRDSLWEQNRRSSETLVSSSLSGISIIGAHGTVMCGVAGCCLGCHTWIWGSKNCIVIPWAETVEVILRGHAFQGHFWRLLPTEAFTSSGNFTRHRQKSEIEAAGSSLALCTKVLAVPLDTTY